MTRTRQYSLVAVNEKTGRVYLFNLKPMTHAQACTMKSKFSPHPLRRIQLQEVAAAS